MTKKIILALILMSVTGLMLLAGIVLAASPSDEEPFDRQECYSRCECRYGLFLACAECKAACERRFWKWWNGKMERAAHPTEPKAGPAKSGRHRNGR